jgi:hypothetical protein
MLRVLRSAAATAALAVIAAAGCSSTGTPGQSPAPGVSEDLSEVAGLLRDYTSEFQKGPGKLADLAKNQPLYPRGYQAVKAGTIAVVWGVRMPQQGQGGTSVIAYEKKVEADGGAVLLENGEVKAMSADEFKSAPKAK